MESKDVRHVLHEHVAGSKLANGSGHLAPQNGLGMPEPVALAGRRGALAGKTAGDDVDTGNSVSSDESDVGHAVEAAAEQPTAVEESADGEHFMPPPVQPR